MAYYKDGNIKFLNPYNFIPLSDIDPRADKISIDTRNKNSDDDHSGCFVCKIEVKTPLVAPDIENSFPDSEIKEHIHYPFMKISGRPTIPAGSLRGPIRSVYETLTNSCMITMDPDEHITKRTDLGTFKPCVLKREKGASGNNEWRIYEAERIALVCDTGSVTQYKNISGGTYTRYRIDKDNKGKLLINPKKTIVEKIYWGDEVIIDTSGSGHEKRYTDRNGVERTQEVWNYHSVSKIDKVYIDASNNTYIKDEGGNRINKSGMDCYLYLGEMISNKHAESVFRIKTPRTPLNYTDDDISSALEGLQYTFNMYNSDSVNRNLNNEEKRKKTDKKSLHFGYSGYERAKDKGILPLWYNDVSGKLYLSFAAIGRISYYRTVKDLSNDHNPCVNRECLCPACTVFGMVGKGRDENNEINKSIGSKVRFTDAVIKDDDPSISLKEITLKELSTPRTSYLKFYSDQGKPYDDPGAKIRGRKNYWHIPAAASDSSIYSTREKTERNATYEFVESGIKFEFKVYYEHLSIEQVKMMAWVITLGGNESNFMHKIGHGKPLGLGSVKIIVDKIIERQYVDDRYYVSSLPVMEPLETPYMIKNNQESKEAWEQFKIIGNFNKESKMKICYPFVETTKNAENIIKEQNEQGRILNENVLAAHQWFSRNNIILPEIEDSKKTLFTNCQVDRFDLRKDFKDQMHHRDNARRTNREEATILQMNTEYVGTVSSYNGQKTVAYINLENGQRASIYFKDIEADYGKINERLPLNTKVTVEYLGKYLGKDKKSFDKWKLIRK